MAFQILFKVVIVLICSTCCITDSESLSDIKEIDSLNLLSRHMFDLFEKRTLENNLLESCKLFFKENMHNSSFDENLANKKFNEKSVRMYDQCMELKVNDIYNTSIVGQYCTIHFQQMNILKQENSSKEVTDFYLSVCSPSTCTSENIRMIFDEINTATVNKFNNLSLQDMSCAIKSSTVELTTSQIVATSILSVMGTLLFIGTVADLILRILHRCKPKPKEGRGKIAAILRSFSLYSNSKKILNYKKTEGNLTAVYGIRFLSMSWIILGQTYFLLNDNFVRNISDVRKYSENFAFQAILRSTVATDVFYFISGLTIVYTTLKRLQDNGGINWPFLYLHRIIRLLPAFGLVILSTFIVPLFGSGLFWDHKWKTLTDRCEKNWWPAILFVNNFVRTEEQCVEQSWFLANIMQFFIITPVVLVLLWKIPLAGLILNTFLLVITFITPALLMMNRDVIPAAVSLTGLSVVDDYMNTIYLKPYSRIGPYAIGIYLGFVLVRYKKIKIFKILQILFWCGAIAINLAVVYGPYQWSRGNFDSKEVNAFYAAANGTAFALGVAWVTFACANGCGGLAHKLLSWRAFIPLSRLTYMAFLMHHFVIHSFNWSLRESITVSLYNLVLLYFAFLVMVFGISFLGSIAFEMPFIELEKVFVENMTNRKEQKDTENTSEANDQSVAEMSTIFAQEQQAANAPGLTNAGYIPESDRQ